MQPTQFYVYHIYKVKQVNPETPMYGWINRGINHLQEDLILDNASYKELAKILMCTLKDKA